MPCADLVDICTMQHADQRAHSILDVYPLLRSELPSTHILSLAILPKGEFWPTPCSDATPQAGAQSLTSYKCWLRSAVTEDFIFINAMATACASHICSSCWR